MVAPDSSSHGGWSRRLQLLIEEDHRQDDKVASHMILDKMGLKGYQHGSKLEILYFGVEHLWDMFEQIGRDIVEKCKGLPLAITLVASLLSKTEEKVEKWKNVAESVIGDSNEACSRVLYLSYNQLPHHLKACFLYFGIFEEDYEISVKKLVRLWAAEGFLSAVKHVNMEKVAMECLQNLVDRSLVIEGGNKIREACNRNHLKIDFLKCISPLLKLTVVTNNGPELPENRFLGFFHHCLDSHFRTLLRHFNVIPRTTVTPVTLSPEIRTLGINLSGS
ncbi:putative disease resistance RPP13-like protein 3 [Ipomoea triloba]|uniref:putative disease resistance RPP13-like protein 3 n=1 Tax=Ipomoea triloba TaxID=35885 RepID=UPI00125CF5CD|nr:putative disease resistance RPP13-like protein 3 [Ipomoea triloba]